MTCCKTKFPPFSTGWGGLLWGENPKLENWNDVFVFSNKNILEPEKFGNFISEITLVFFQYPRNGWQPLPLTWTLCFSSASTMSLTSKSLLFGLFQDQNDESNHQRWSRNVTTNFLHPLGTFRNSPSKCRLVIPLVYQITFSGPNVQKPFSCAIPSQGLFERLWFFDLPTYHFGFFAFYAVMDVDGRPSRCSFSENAMPSSTSFARRATVKNVGAETLNVTIKSLCMSLVNIFLKVFHRLITVKYS